MPLSARTLSTVWLWSRVWVWSVCRIVRHWIQWELHDNESPLAPADPRAADPLAVGAHEDQDVEALVAMALVLEEEEEEAMQVGQTQLAV